MAFKLILLLLVLMQLTFSSAHGSHAATPVHCLPDQAASLLQLKQSFSFYDSTTTLHSWQAGTDCCFWEGIGCDASSGQVTALRLGGRGLYSDGINSVLFNLTSLQHLDLSGNDFGTSHLPVIRFERLSLLTHLNLSRSGIHGQIPISMAYLTSLISLDLSNQLYSKEVLNKLVLWEPGFTALVANLSNLRELHLDLVDIAASGEEWCSALARHAPRLEILSLAYSGLHGPIHPSISTVDSLTVINLRGNRAISGVVPDLFADFLNLSVLQLGECGFNGFFPARIFELENLRDHDVSYNRNLLGRLPYFLNGSSLEKLDIRETSFSASSPRSFSNLRELSISGRSINLTLFVASSFNSLQKLHMSQLEHESSFSWIGDLTNLTELEISYCDFSKRMPSWVGNLRKLTILMISFCNFSEPIPSAIGNLKNLKGLKLSDCGLTGRIPASVANLTQLTYLDLQMNHLNGKLPDFVFTLPAFRILDLSSNQLSGQLRDFPTSSSSLALINLNGNELGGLIPKAFFQLNSLMALVLGSNNFNGQVGLNSLLRLRNLAFLDLSYNRLSVIDGGGIPHPSVSQLQVLDLASCNLTKIPDSLQFLHYVSSLDISNNHISGSIPKWMWDNWSDRIQYLNLSNNMFSSMGLSSSFLTAEVLDTLDLSSNRLEGEIPLPLKPINKQLLDYSNNRFTSIMKNCTSCLSKTIYLRMSNNRIRGNIPQFFCNTSNFQVLDLSSNSFSGKIPSCLLENSQLSILNLRDNHLKGTLASNINSRCALQTINLDGNKIEGHLPRSLANCKDLEFLDVGNNKIVDSFPHWLGKLPKLRVLVLRSNQLHGSIGNTPEGEDYGEPFSSLQIIDVASNNLSGNLSSPWFEKLLLMIKRSDFTGDVMEAQNLTGSYEDVVTVMFKGQYMTFEKIWTTLTMIDFSDNAFTGSIPESIGRLARLHGLNLSNNMLTGEIPAQLGSMAALESLDLSSNELSGVIPEELTDLTSLGTLNLSNNQFIGKIPESRQFGTFQNNSYEGNAGLCGAPLSKQCDSQGGGPIGALARKSSDQVDVILFLFIGIGYGLGFAAGLLIKWSRISKWYRTTSTS